MFELAPNEIGKESPAALTLPKITERYFNYEPPFDVAGVVRRMLESVPAKYLNGLSEIVLTNRGSLSRSRRRSVTKTRGRKARIVESLGAYHPVWKGKPAWIEIFVDNTLQRIRGGRWLPLFRVLREQEIGHVLFHEIGHHIHYTVRPEYREKEDVADVWKVRLGKIYTRSLWARHPFLNALFIPIKPLLRSLGKASTAFLMRKGRVSRAEFNERFKDG